MIKVVVLFLCVLIVFSMITIFSNFQQNSNTETEEPYLYLGPIPLGYNETHFRLTGETIKNG